MSAAVATPTIDVSGTSQVPLWRLIKVEMRKMGDTRAGFWLLATIASIAVLVTGGFFIWGNEDERAFLDLLSYAGIPLGVLLPVLGILLITQEWGQRTALVTFTQVPHRSRIIVAKVAAALLFALAGMIIAAAIAAPLSLLGGLDEPFDDVSVGVISRVMLGMAIGIVWGLAFGAAFLNSAFAIVLYFLVPMIVSIITEIWTAARDQLLWFDLNSSSTKLFEPGSLSGEEWAQLGTGTLLWIVLPGAFGIWRILRSEVK